MLRFASLLLLCLPAGLIPAGGCRDQADEKSDPSGPDREAVQLDPDAPIERMVVSPDGKRMLLVLGQGENPQEPAADRPLLVRLDTGRRVEYRPEDFPEEARFLMGQFGPDAGGEGPMLAFSAMLGQVGSELTVVRIQESPDRLGRIRSDGMVFGVFCGENLAISEVKRDGSIQRIRLVTPRIERVDVFETVGGVTQASGDGKWLLASILPDHPRGPAHFTSRDTAPALLSGDGEVVRTFPGMEVTLSHGGAWLASMRLEDGQVHFQMHSPDGRDIPIAQIPWNRPDVHPSTELELLGPLDSGYLVVWARSAQRILCWSLEGKLARRENVRAAAVADDKIFFLPSRSTRPELEVFDPESDS